MATKTEAFDDWLGLYNSDMEEIWIREPEDLKKATMLCYCLNLEFKKIQNQFEQKLNFFKNQLNEDATTRNKENKSPNSDFLSESDTTDCEHQLLNKNTTNCDSSLDLSNSPTFDRKRFIKNRIQKPIVPRNLDIVFKSPKDSKRTSADFDSYIECTPEIKSNVKKAKISKLSLRSQFDSGNSLQSQSITKSQLESQRSQLTNQRSQLESPRSQAESKRFESESSADQLASSKIKKSPSKNIKKVQPENTKLQPENKSSQLSQKSTTKFEKFIQKPKRAKRKPQTSTLTQLFGSQRKTGSSFISSSEESVDWDKTKTKDLINLTNIVDELNNADDLNNAKDLNNYKDSDNSTGINANGHLNQVKDLNKVIDLTEDSNKAQNLNKLKDSNECNKIVESNQASNHDETFCEIFEQIKTPLSSSFIANYDNFPSRTRRNSQDVNYVYKQPTVRGKDRQKLHGWACDDCKKFYEGLDLSPRKLKEAMDKCSRHRNKFMPQPETPPGYWEFNTLSTQD